MSQRGWVDSGNMRASAAALRFGPLKQERGRDHRTGARWESYFRSMRCSVREHRLREGQADTRCPAGHP